MTDATSGSGAAQLEELLELLLTENDPHGARSDFMGTQFDLGLAWVAFPEGAGGLGLAPALQGIVDDRLDAATPHRPRTFDVLGHGMGAPMLIEHGTPDQRDRWLRPMFTGDEVWCQMFSEPGAGSDLAGLSTRAVRDGDEWVVNGQKVWTTVAHIARWGMLVTRTNPDLPKHRGLTYFVVDMESPGVEVRPLRQITGEAEFSEVYFTDVRIPDANRIGDPGDGWRVSLTTLMNERVAIGARTAERGEGAIADLVAAWRAAGPDPMLRDDLMRLWVESEAARLTNLRASQNRVAGTPGPEGSTAKLVYAELNKRIYELTLDVLGARGMLYGSYEMTQPMPGDERSAGLPERFLRARANSIEGGTSEIMKNILGERVLGLPGEPRVDTDLPWAEVKRG